MDNENDENRTVHVAVAETKVTVTRVAVDAAAALAAILPRMLVIDLAPGQRVCSCCHGLGIAPTSQHYGLRSDRIEAGAAGFPYVVESLFTPCPYCYIGVQQLCEYCGKPCRKEYTKHDCKRALAAKHAADAAKEEARRAGLEHIPLSEYKGGALYDENAGEYVYPDEWHDLDPDGTYFACHESKKWLHPDADVVIERMMEQASEDVEEGPDLVSLKAGAEAKLQEALGAWMAEHVELSSTYWRNGDVIVDVPPLVADDDDDGPEADLARAEREVGPL